MANGECEYTRPLIVGRQPARCYRCHLYLSSGVIFVSTTPLTWGRLACLSQYFGIFPVHQSRLHILQVSLTKANSSSAPTASQASFTTRLSKSRLLCQGCVGNGWGHHVQSEIRVLQFSTSTNGPPPPPFFEKSFLANLCQNEQQTGAQISTGASRREGFEVDVSQVGCRGGGRWLNTSKIKGPSPSGLRFRLPRGLPLQPNPTIASTPLFCWRHLERPRRLRGERLYQSAWPVSGHASDVNSYGCLVLVEQEARLLVSFRARHLFQQTIGICQEIESFWKEQEWAHAPTESGNLGIVKYRYQPILASRGYRYRLCIVNCEHCKDSWTLSLRKATGCWQDMSARYHQ